MTLFDHHVHTDRSDGRRSLADRARSALVRPHGVSDHYPWRDKLRDDDDVLRYVDDATRLGLRVGLEYDLGVAPPLRRVTRDALAYLIGSVHQVFVGGARIGFDEAGARLKARRAGPAAEAARLADPELRARVLEETIALVRHGIGEVGIDIVGHPTLTPLAASGAPEEGLSVEWQERLIDLCASSAVAIEVNEAYGVPHRAFLVRARERGALFAVGSDAHGEIGPLDRTEAMIRDADLPRERFLAGARVRHGPVRPSAARSS